MKFTMMGSVYGCQWQGMERKGQKDEGCGSIEEVKKFKEIGTYYGDVDGTEDDT